jgi:F0F1-type ATP synthase assembly protein I
MDALSKSDAPGLNAALTLAAATAGGVIGYFIFGWLVSQGFYAPAIPGVLLGFGGGFVATQRNVPVAAICGVVALALCLFAEWRHFPFAYDDSLSYFLAHLADLRPLTLIMVGLGGFAGFWFVWRSRNNRPPHSPPRS